MKLRCFLKSIALSGMFFCVGGASGVPTTQRAIELDPTKLQAVVGQYQLEPNQVLSISRFRNRLFARTTGRHPFAIYPESETVFFYGDSDARITIDKDPQGKVTAARYDQGELHRTGKRISDLPFDPIEAPETVDSPRLIALAKALDNRDEGALDNFWKEVQDHAPLIEPFPNDAHSSLVTFLFHGDSKTHAVLMRGGPWALSTDGRAMNLERLRQTDVWYRSVRVPNDARIVYDYEINLSGHIPDDPVIERKLYDFGATADVLNANFIEATGSMRPVFSLLEMPDAPPQPYIHPTAGTPKGKITQHKIKSSILNQPRTYAIYTPPGYDEKGDALPLVVMFDGSSYYTEGYIPGDTIIDNMIAAKKIPPIVVAFVDSNNRQKDLACSKDFAAFVAKELVPQVRTERHVATEAKQTTIGGVSLGGLMAAYCALQHSDVFGNVISQSGAFWYFPGCFEPPTVLVTPDGPLTTEFVKSPKLPVRFYLEAGKFENDIPGDLLAENRRLRDVLRAKGNEVIYSEFSGGHHFVSWRGSFSDALIAVTQ